MNGSRIVYRIDLAQLEKNFAYLQSCAKSCKLMPVLKYDAYGMGAAAIGEALKNAGAYRFAAATLDIRIIYTPLGAYFFGFASTFLRVSGVVTLTYR